MKAPKSDKQIKEMLAGFVAPIRKSKVIISDIMCKVLKIRDIEKQNAQLAKVETLESLLHYATHIQVELNESNDNVGKWFMAYSDLKNKYDQKCRDLGMLEKISEIGFEDYKKQVDDYLENEVLIKYVQKNYKL